MIDDARGLGVVVPSARAFPEQLVTRLAACPDVAELVLVRNEPEPGRHPWRGGATTCEPRAIENVIVIASDCGAAAARNAGWRATRGPWVVFLDDDVVVSADALLAMREVSKRADPGVITFRVRSLPTQFTALVTSTVGLDRGSATRCTRGEPLRLQHTWQYGVGAALMVHRSILETTGGFKNELGAGRRIGGAEDLEFLWHASRHCEVSYRGDIAVDHADVSNGRDLGLKFRQYARALGGLGGAVGGREGRAMTLGYARHIASAPLRAASGDGVFARARLLASGVVAAAETVVTYGVVAASAARPQVLCSGCRRS